MPELSFRWLGKRPYAPVLDEQNRIADALRTAAPDQREVFLAVEHEPVITVGRRGSWKDIHLSSDDLLARGVEVFDVDRGGEVTYHGPGQLVLYPIVRVVPNHFGVGDLVRALAGAIGDELSAIGIATVYDASNPGLWILDEKICAVGMRVSRGVSTHGAAVNVTTDLSAFSLIVPCGKSHGKTTSVEQHLSGPSPPLERLASSIADRFAKRLGFVVTAD